MTRTCERPDCAARASVAYGFDAARRMAWFAELTSVPEAASLAGALCGAHARAMVLPRGWWLDDRREHHSGTLFAAPRADDRGLGSAPATGFDPPPAATDPVRRRPRRVKPTTTWVEVPLPLDSAGPAASADDGVDTDADDGVGVGAVEATGSADGAEHQPAQPIVPTDDDTDAEPGVDDAGPVDRVVVPWRPRFDQADDLGGVLAARSPLLARAFGGLRRSATPPPRDE